MRRVIVSNQISIDGVIESPSPDSWYIAEGSEGAPVTEGESRWES